MSALLKRLSIVTLIGSLGACTLTPVDLLIPAGVALVNHVSSDDGTGPISVSAMIKRVRGEPETDEEIGGPMSVEEMLANARGDDPDDAAEVQEVTGEISVAAMLANARAADPSAATDSVQGPAPSTPQTGSSISLDALRAQVLARAPDAAGEQVCR